MDVLKEGGRAGFFEVLKEDLIGHACRRKGEYVILRFARSGEEGRPGEESRPEVTREMKGMSVYASLVSNGRMCCRVVCSC